MQSIYQHTKSSIQNKSAWVLEFQICFIIVYIHQKIMMVVAVMINSKIEGIMSNCQGMFHLLFRIFKRYRLTLTLSIWGWPNIKRKNKLWLNLQYIILHQEQNIATYYIQEERYDVMRKELVCGYRNYLYVHEIPIEFRIQC